MTSFLTLGLMSGTSMDGLDIALVKFEMTNGTWNYDLEYCKTYAYPESWLGRLIKSKELSGLELMITDRDLGLYFGQRVNQFLNEFHIKKDKIDFISSHGHTIFHQPEVGLTTQIGCGQSITHETGIPVINDFRTKNVLAGGQGAPLVPIGDLLLFREHDACLNIGGFCNISIKNNDQIIAYDICPGNLPLNLYAQRMGYDYDNNGQIAKTGELNVGLLDQLNMIPFYQEKYPKSLGTEWLEKQFLNKILNSISNEDVLRNLTEHISTQISRTLEQHKVKNVLITGGGAKNTFLIDSIRAKTSSKIEIPEENLIDFKEALIFGFLGVLYTLKCPNTLASVTGSNQDIIGGTFHLP